MAFLFNKLRQSSTIKLFNKFVNLLSEHKNLALYLYAFVLGLLVFVRMFDNSVWGDEARVVNACRLSLEQLILYIAVVGHSPFHYLVAWTLVKVFGESGFVFHLSATLPYFIILLLGVTTVKKWFGIKSSTIFITFCTLLKCAVIYNLEIRMYAWCSLFCLVCYLTSYQLYVNKSSVKYYIVLGLFSVLAAYSHYFSLACIGFIYCFLLISIFIKNKFSNLHMYSKPLLSVVIFILLFIPWIIYVKEHRTGVISNYSIPLVSWRSCFGFIFNTNHKWLTGILFGLWILFPLAYCFNKCNVVEINKIRNTLKHPISYKNILNKIYMTGYNYWIITGYIVVIGTITLSQVFSIFIFPITLHRYLYVTFIVAWLILSIEISSVCKSNFIFLVFIALSVIGMLPYSVQIINLEYINNQRHLFTMSLTKDKIHKNNIVYSDNKHFVWMLCDAYYPGIPHNAPDQLTLPLLKKDTVYFFFLRKPISKEIEQYLSLHNRTYQLIVDNGFVGAEYLWIYKIK